LRSLKDYLTSTPGRQYQRNVDPPQKRLPDDFACFDDTRECWFRTKNGDPSRIAQCALEIDPGNL
jgi:hypothetical protein